MTVLNSLQGEDLYQQGRLNYHVYYGYLLFSIDILKKFILPHKIKQKILYKDNGLKADDFQILRCYGRYANAAITEEMKYPKLLPQIHFTSLIMEVHQRGISHTLGQICQEYWIPQGRAEVRHVLSQCVVCKRHGGLPFSLPNMPPWPANQNPSST